ncbi:zinc finger protein ZAT4-like [Neltuma alba]|uniref:zinc finger protein ZAT4-like n=1 Tax=Neltuma alba TaxID=207710 RepID=UPI0010A3076B|nr:zinc finger protein ZAT4-like [Prosopis alba]
MDSDEENRVLFYRQVKSHGDGFDQMIEDQKDNEGFDQGSSDELQKMSEKPFSSYLELREGKSESKTNGASASGSSSVRVCDFCGREFSSGKALGGHRRYHIQAQKKMEAQSQAQEREKVNRHQYPSNNYTLRIKPNNISEDCVGDDNLIIKSNIGNLNSSRSFRCCVCDKNFPSKKSLFGHMRSHPEREWRGMNPPFTDHVLASSSSAEVFKVEDKYQDNDEVNLNNNNGSSSSTLEESVVVDLSSSCSGSSWRKKDRRGRKSIGAAEAAQTLIEMYLYGSYEPLLPVKKRNRDVNDVGSSQPGKQSSDYKEKLELKADENNIWEMKVISLMKEKKLRKKNKKLKKGPEIIKSEGEVLIRTLKEEVKKSQSYVCDICNKPFSSFQALGGHKSKHNRGKNIVISTKGKEVVEEQRGGGGEAEEEEDKVCINGALSSAGLMSCEEEEDEEEEGEGASLIVSEERLGSSSNDQENNSNEEELGEASHQSAGSKILDFDLNVPYVSEHEVTDDI